MSKLKENEIVFKTVPSEIKNPYNLFTEEIDDKKYIIVPKEKKKEFAIDLGLSLMNVFDTMKYNNFDKFDFKGVTVKQIGIYEIDMTMDEVRNDQSADFEKELTFYPANNISSIKDKKFRNGYKSPILFLEWKAAHGTESYNLELYQVLNSKGRAKFNCIEMKEDILISNNYLTRSIIGIFNKKQKKKMNSMPKGEKIRIQGLCKKPYLMSPVFTANAWAKRTDKFLKKYNITREPRYGNIVENLLNEPASADYVTIFNSQEIDKTKKLNDLEMKVEIF